jgi:hypothetical protein
MIKKKTKLLKPKDAPLTEEEYDEMASEEGFRIDQERYLNYFNQFDKPQLIQLLMEAQDREDRFSGWLLLKEWSMADVKDEFGRLRSERHERLKKQIRGRREQSRRESALAEAKALGVEDYYGLIREAIIQIDREGKDEEGKRPKTKRLRAAIVDLLCQSNRSKHNHDRAIWIYIVRATVTPKHVDTAKKQIQRESA